MAFCVVAALVCRAESRSHGSVKISALLARMDRSRALRHKIAQGSVVVDELRGPDDCDGGIVYWCPDTDTCCPHPADWGPGSFVCCPPDTDPICATSVDVCYTSQ